MRALTRRAGIKPTVTRIQPGDSLLTRIAPGERTYVAAGDLPAVTSTASSNQGRNPGGNRSRRNPRNGSGGAGRRSGGRSRSSRNAGGSGSRAHSAASFSSSRRAG